MTTTPQAALLSDALEKMGDFFHAHEAWQLCRIDDGRIQLHLTDDQYEAVRLAVADKLKPRSSTLTNDELIDLAVEHGLGRTLPPLGLNTGNVFYTDNSYRTAALFDFADAHEAAILAKLQATQEPVQAGELPPLPDPAHRGPTGTGAYFNSFTADQMQAYARAALSARKPLTPLVARQLGEWHEDDGPVMWWAWNGHEWAGEPAWCGQPTDSDWPGYHTHWTPHPQQPAAHGIGLEVKP